MKNNMKIPKKLKIELPCYPGIQILGTPNKMKSLSALPYSMASFFTLDNIQKKHRWPKRWMAKEKVLCISKGILFINEEEWNTALCNNMDGPWQHYAQWNKSEEKDKYCMISHTCGIRKTELVTKRGKNGGYQGQRDRRNGAILANRSKLPAKN